LLKKQKEAYDGFELIRKDISYATLQDGIISGTDSLLQEQGVIDIKLTKDFTYTEKCASQITKIVAIDF